MTHHRFGFLLLAATAALAWPYASSAVDASAPRATTLNVYDSGFALVNELRSAVFSAGEDQVVLRQLPARLDPSTISFATVAGGKGLDVMEQRFENDTETVDGLFRRYLNRAIKVDAGGAGLEGRLIGVPVWHEPPMPSDPLLLSMADGSVRAFYNPDQAGEVSFPDSGRAAYLEPTLVWRARSAQEGPQNIRLSYVADGVEWGVTYDVLLSEDGATAELAARAMLRNRSGGRFQDARVKLILTERGRVAPVMKEAGAEETEKARYAYLQPEPQAARDVASLAPVNTYEVPRPMTLNNGDEAYVQLARTEKLPVSRFYVYDGVQFDRFQRNRRNDWNYGTDYQETVDTHLEFQNTTDGGLGFDLPPGRVNLYKSGADDSIDLLGSDYLAAIPAGQAGHMRVGPARGLRGERERVGYTEVKPLHEYEESFEIRLSNESDAPAQIRVVEHLYRWHDYELVKADAEYTTVAPQTIEFRPDLKPGGKRSIHYTVRYRW